MAVFPLRRIKVSVSDSGRLKPLLIPMLHLRKQLSSLASGRRPSWACEASGKVPEPLLLGSFVAVIVQLSPNGGLNSLG